MNPVADPKVTQTADAIPAEVLREFRQAQMREWIMAVLPPVFGLLVFFAIWEAVTLQTKSFPAPAETWKAAVELFSKPFYVNGPNDQGIGWNILSSLQRIAIGFGLAALVGIPAGFIIGRFKFLAGMASPVISLLRPVSPLVWLPLAMMVTKANPAAIWVIFISSIWPIILNTAAGVAQVPQDYLNVARVLNLSEWKVFTRILLPSVLPHLLTGIRLSVGVAWLVIVAAEMLSGGVGLGFWVWDEYNNGSHHEHIVVAVFIVGIVGLLLEQALIRLANCFNYQ